MFSHCTNHPTQTTVYCHECIQEREAKMAAVIEAAKDAVKIFFRSNDDIAPALQDLDIAIRDYEGKK